MDNTTSGRWKSATSVVLILMSPLLPVAGVLLASVDLKRLLLRIAGFVVNGVKDDVGTIAVASILSIAVVWLAILVRCLMEWRIDSRAPRPLNGYSSQR